MNCNLESAEKVREVFEETQMRHFDVKMNTDVSVVHGLVSDPAALIVLRGEDVFDFLQSQGTADMRSCKTGRVVYSLWLDHRGLIHGDGFVWRANDDAWWILSEWTPAKSLIAKFENHIIADDVVIENLTDSGLKVAQPEPRSDVPRCDSGAGRAMKTGERWLLELPGRGRGLCVLLTPTAEDVLEPYSLRGDRATRERIDRSELAIGIDLVAGRWNPVEAGLMDAVSADKGCYLGQEVVARAHRLGRRSKRFVAASSLSAKEALSACPIALMVEGESVGELTSVVAGFDGVHALGWLKTRFPDGELKTDDGRCWTVSSL